jgi:hypothetical protein
VKLKLFEILQSGSDDSAFSEWAKKKINSTEHSAKTEKPVVHSSQLHTGQNQNQRQ